MLNAFCGKKKCHVLAHVKHSHATQNTMADPHPKRKKGAHVGEWGAHCLFAHQTAGQQRTVFADVKNILHFSAIVCNGPGFYLLPHSVSLLSFPITYRTLQCVAIICNPVFLHSLSQMTSLPHPRGPPRSPPQQNHHSKLL